MDDLERIGREVAFIEEIRQQELEQALARGELGPNDDRPDRPGCLVVLVSIVLVVGTVATFA